MLAGHADLNVASLPNGKQAHNVFERAGSAHLEISIGE